MINLLIVDDEKLIRDGLNILLSTYEDINVVELCKDGEEAVKVCTSKQVDIVLMDIRMDKCDGVLATKLIKALNNKIKILILTTFKDEEYIYSALNNGASGYLLKDSSKERIYEAIKGACLGDIIVHPEVAGKLMNNRESIIKPDTEEFELTQKEYEIIRSIGDGLSNKEIGDKLFLTEGTVKNNITVILSKLSLRDRTQIAIFAFRNNIIK